MAFDYAQLQSDIALWTARDDLAPAIPTFVRLAEDQISRVVRSLAQETDVTLTCSTPDFSDDLPDGFLGFKHVYVSGATDPTTIYVPPQVFHEGNQLPNDGFTSRGSQLQYTIESNKIKVNQPTGSATTITLETCYIKRFGHLADGSNWLIENHYDLYMWACLVEAWDYIDEEAPIAKYQARFDRALKQLDKQEITKRIPSGPLVSRPPRAVT